MYVSQLSVISDFFLFFTFSALLFSLHNFGCSGGWIEPHWNMALMLVSGLLFFSVVLFFTWSHFEAHITNEVAVVVLHLISCAYITWLEMWEVCHGHEHFIVHVRLRIGVHDSAFGWGTALQASRLRVRFPMVSLEFFIYIILLAALWPWGWLNLCQKWVPGIFLGG